MLLIFCHDRLDFGKFPDLMTNRFRVKSCQLRAASTTGVGLKRNNLLTLFRWNQFSVMFLMALLPAPFSLLAISLVAFWFGMWMLRTRR